MSGETGSWGWSRVFRKECTGQFVVVVVVLYCLRQKYNNNFTENNWLFMMKLLPSIKDLTKGYRMWHHSAVQSNKSNFTVSFHPCKPHHYNSGSKTLLAKWKWNLIGNWTMTLDFAGLLNWDSTLVTVSTKCTSKIILPVCRVTLSILRWWVHTVSVMEVSCPEQRSTTTLFLETASFYIEENRISFLSKIIYNRMWGGFFFKCMRWNCIIFSQHTWHHFIVH